MYDDHVVWCLLVLSWFGPCCFLLFGVCVVVVADRVLSRVGCKTLLAGFHVNCVLSCCRYL